MHTSVGRILLLLGLVSAFFLAFTILCYVRSVENENLRGFSPFNLPSLTGSYNVSIRGLNDSGIVLIFVSQGCRPCEELLEDLGALPLEEYEHVKFVVIVLAENKSIGLKEYGDYLTQNVVFLFDENLQTFKKYGICAVPTTILIDREGKIALKVVGDRSIPELEKALEKFE